MCAFVSLCLRACVRVCVCVWNTCLLRSLLGLIFAGGAGGTDETGTNKDAHQLPVKQWGTLHCVPAACDTFNRASCVLLPHPYLFLSEDGKRLSHNPLNVLLLCVGKTEHHVIRVCPEGGLHECACMCVCVGCDSVLEPTCK